MNYATIKKTDVADGEGVRVSLFVSGCTHHCKGCFNSETWDFDYGQPFSREVAEEIFAACLPDYISGLSLLGGEPFERPNQSELAGLLEEFKRRFPSKTVWCYTGYLFDRDILENMAVKWDEPMRMLSNIDVLVDGEFVEEKKDLKLRFRGSSNQRIIDVKKSLATGQVVLAEEFYERRKNDACKGQKARP